MTEKEKINAKYMPAQKLIEDRRITVYQGWIYKYNRCGKAQWRYCIINKGVFYYYKNPQSIKPCGWYKMEGYQAIPADTTVKNTQNKCIFQVKNVKEDMRIYTFKTVTEDELNTWVKKIEEAVIKAFPTSLYKPEDGPSENYDYIQAERFCKRDPYGSYEVKGETSKTLEAQYRGPKVEKKGLGHAPTYVPNIPIVPERSPSSLSHQNNEYSAGDNTRHLQRPLSKQDNIEDDGYISGFQYTGQPGHNMMSDEYVSMGKTNPGSSKNTMQYGYESMATLQNANNTERHSQEIQWPTSPGVEPPGNSHIQGDADELYVALVESDCEDDNDDDSEDPHLPPRSNSKESKLSALGRTPPRSNSKESKLSTLGRTHVDSQDGWQYNDDDGCYENDVNWQRQMRAMSVQCPEKIAVYKPILRKAETLPPYQKTTQNKPSPDHQSRAALAPPIEKRMSAFQPSTLDGDEYLVPDVLQREECARVLCKYEVGTYLLRKSKDNLDALAVLARKDVPKVKHFKVFQNDEGYRYLAKEEPRFLSLSELIKHYYKHNLPQTYMKLISPHPSVPTWLD